MSNIDISFYKSLLIRTAFIGGWALDAPNADPDDGFSARTDDSDFIEGQLFEGSEPFLFTASDGGMVFKSTMNGVTTSGTSFVRSELREMLRAGADGVSTQGVNENNWVLGYQPTALEFGEHTSSAQDQTPTEVGGRNGKLTATLRVNQVTTTGRNSRVGRVIIGQIHADDDEPMRLYYRKLPTNEKGDMATTQSTDDDGNLVTGSGYDLADEWMYFKAGAYSQNNTDVATDRTDGRGADSEDYDQVTFYRLENTHD